MLVIGVRVSAGHHKVACSVLHGQAEGANLTNIFHHKDYCVCCCIVNLSTEVSNKLRIYQEYFEKNYISSAEEFYQAHGQAYLSENGVQNYMKYVSE